MLGVRCVRGIQLRLARRIFFDALTERGDVCGVYVNAKTKVEVFGSCGHTFSITPNDYKYGKGCAKCSKHGFNASAKAVVYVLGGVDGLVKVGISNDFERRIKQLTQRTPFNFVVVSVDEVEGSVARLIESKIHSRKKDVTLDKFDGYTEWGLYNESAENIFNKR